MIFNTSRRMTRMFIGSSFTCDAAKNPKFDSRPVCGRTKKHLKERSFVRIVTDVSYNWCEILLVRSAAADADPRSMNYGFERKDRCTDRRSFRPNRVPDV